MSWGGYSPRHLRLQPPPPTVTSPATYGYSPRHLRLQPPPPTVTAPATYGYSPRHLRLQVSDELGRLAQAYSVSEVELGELGAAG